MLGDVGPWDPAAADAAAPPPPRYPTVVSPPRNLHPLRPQFPIPPTAAYVHLLQMSSQYLLAVEVADEGGHGLDAALARHILGVWESACAHLSKR